MAKDVLKVKKGIQQLERVGGRAGSDTIRLWEGFREQALLWRALAILQMPSTALSVAAALVMYFYADTIIEVPEHPQPGIYSITQLPDSQFIDAAQAVVNLISTYQPAIARRQFKTARKYLWEPALSQFEADMMQTELKLIEETKRSQMFFANPRLIKVDRYPELDRVIVRIPGVRQKLIGNKPLPADEIIFYVKMTTIPRNVGNEYGIVIVDLRLRRADERQIEKEDVAETRAEQKSVRKAIKEGKEVPQTQGEAAVDSSK